MRLRPVAAFLIASGMGMTLGAQLPSQVEPVFETKMISSGQNAPAVRLQEGGLDRLCLLLHQGWPLPTVRARLGWAEEVLTQRLAMLQTEGLVKADGKGGFRPSFLVLTRTEAQVWMGVEGGLVSRTCDLIRARLPLLEARWRTLPAMGGISFREGSLYLLSDVLLDDLQIGQVERDFVRAPRPLRNGKSYYFALQETEAGNEIEAFGIYGNSVTRHEGLALCLYGNRRKGENLNTLSAPALQTLFGVTAGSPREACGALALELLHYTKDPGTALSPRHREGFERLGLIREGRSKVPVLGPEDRKQLSGIAALVTKDLLEILEPAREPLREIYTRSPYAAEITFEEYLIWWYHFFYTRVTDRLITEGIITLPKGGVFTYLLEG